MNSPCEDQLTIARRQLEAVQRISAALYSTNDLEALQRESLQTAMDVIGAEAGSLLIYEPERNVLVFRIVVGPVAETLLGTELDLNIGSGIAGLVFHSGVSRITHDAEADSDHVGTVDARTGFRTHSLMTVPLRRSEGGLPVGIVQLLNKRDRDFDESDIAVTEIMGSLVGMAVRNAILGQRARLAAVAYSVGEISHDIGNMLTYVLPYVQTLDAYIADVRADKPDAQEALEHFYREVVDNVASGVEQVQLRAKEIARAVKGEVAPLEFAPGKPYQTAVRVVANFHAAAARQGVSLRADGEANLEAVYDEGRLYNALTNLVGNALAETPLGGEVNITTASCSNDPTFFTVSVTDTGRGMPEEVRKTLFTPAARSTKPGGTGLGTRIVRRTVEQHGGTAHVRSVLGEGTTITLRLPKTPTPEARSVLAAGMEVA